MQDCSCVEEWKTKWTEADGETGERWLNGDEEQVKVGVGRLRSRSWLRKRTRNDKKHKEAHIENTSNKTQQKTMRRNVKWITNNKMTKLNSLLKQKTPRTRRGSQTSKSVPKQIFHTMISTQCLFRITLCYSHKYLQDCSANRCKNDGQWKPSWIGSTPSISWICTYHNYYLRVSMKYVQRFMRYFANWPPQIINPLKMATTQSILKMVRLYFLSLLKVLICDLHLEGVCFHKLLMHIQWMP